MVDYDVVGIVLARSGSKRLPGKNKESLGGIRLIDITIRNAHDAGIKAVAVCSDYSSYPIKAVDGCNVIRIPRPTELSHDDVPSSDVVAHVITCLAEQGITFNYLCLLQVTCPLINAFTLKQTLIDTMTNELPGCVSITPAFKPSGGFYIVKKSTFMHTHHTMDQDGLWPHGLSVVKLEWRECIDIDELPDLRIAQALFNCNIRGDC